MSADLGVTQALEDSLQSSCCDVLQEPDSSNGRKDGQSSLEENACTLGLGKHFLDTAPEVWPTEATAGAVGHPEDSRLVSWKALRRK